METMKSQGTKQKQEKKKKYKREGVSGEQTRLTKTNILQTQSVGGCGASPGLHTVR